MIGITSDRIDPEKLRAAAEIRNVTTWLSILASCGPMLADAIEIADSCARSDIECHCRGDFERGYDLASAEPEDSEMLVQAVRYLTARGLIERDGEIVRFKA